MEKIIYLEQPNLHKPYLIIGFEGWPNAAEVSSYGLQYLLEKLEAKKFACVLIYVDVKFSLGKFNPVSFRNANSF